jgi:aminopeptidase N
MFVFIFSCKTPKIETKTLPEITVKPENVLPPIYNPSTTKPWDLIHTKLDVKFEFEKQYLYGQATIDLKPHFQPKSFLYLDARGMTINWVKVIDGKDTVATNYKYENDSLLITFNKSFSKDEKVTLYIDYISKPNELKDIEGSEAIKSDKGLYFINPDGKTPNKPTQIWTQGETQANSVWFPTIDVPNQKTTEEINITVNNKYKTLSNGVLVKSIANADSTRTDSWKLDKPHAPYLFMMAIGEFAVVKDQWRGREVNYYVEPKYEKVAKKIFGNTPEMLEFFSNKLGVEYAWPKYSQVVARDYVSGAMENTSATLHGAFLQRDERELLDETNEDVISHELFHQWFGDLVTCESWANLPLNESFATYGEYLWNEYKYGREIADVNLNKDLNSYLEEAKGKQENLIRFNYDNREDMFDRHSYQKGGTVLHMLRKYVGDDAFFASLKKYLNDNAYKNVEIHQLRLAFEEVTGEDLNWFFNQWFLSKGHPVLDYNYEWNELTKTATVNIQQFQDLNTTALYKIPMQVDLYFNDSIRREQITLDKQIQKFTFNCATKPLVINVDAEKNVTCTKTDHHSAEEWKVLYEKGKLFLDRYEALNGLKEFVLGSDGALVFKSALHDKNEALRVFAIEHCDKLSKDPTLENKLVSLIQNDPVSAVRAAAIYKFGELYNDKKNIEVIKKATLDSSFNVLEASIDYLIKNAPEDAMTMVKAFEKEDHPQLKRIVAYCYSKVGSDNQFEYMLQHFKSVSGGQAYTATQNFSGFITKCRDLKNISNGINAINEKAITAEEWYVRLASVQAFVKIHEELTKLKTITDKEKKISESLKITMLQDQIESNINSLKKNEKNEMLIKIYKGEKE